MRKSLAIRRDLIVKFHESHDCIEHMEKLSKGATLEEFEKAIEELMRKMKS